MDCTSPVFPVLHYLWSMLKLMSIEPVMPSNHVILCRLLLLLPSTFPSIRDFFSESAFCNRWPKYWSSCFSISPSSEYSGLISLKTDWFDLISVQGTLNSLLQHHSSTKTSLLWCSSSMKPHISVSWLPGFYHSSGAILREASSWALLLSQKALSAKWG